jgi:G3E family GTPase
MTRLCLITGFLGAGKTTLVKRLLALGGRTGVIVNDFGPVNVDAALLSKEGVVMAALENGSVFCACIKDRFMQSLIDLSGMALERLFVEASGLADPAGMARILHEIAPRLAEPYDYAGSICVVDATNFVEMSDLLPALASQAEYASAFIINKADLADEQAILAVGAELGRLNPDAAQHVASFCAVDAAALLETLSPPGKEARESLNTPVSRPAVFVLRSLAPVERAELEAFLAQIAPHAYRIKGFALTDEGTVEAEGTPGRTLIETYDGPLPPEGAALVVISAEGIRLVSRIAKALSGGLKGKLTL